MCHFAESNWEQESFSVQAISGCSLWWKAAFKTEFTMGSKSDISLNVPSFVHQQGLFLHAQEGSKYRQQLLANNLLFQCFQNIGHSYRGDKHCGRTMGIPEWSRKKRIVILHDSRTYHTCAAIIHPIAGSSHAQRLKCHIRVMILDIVITVLLFNCVTRKAMHDQGSGCG